MSPNRSRMQGLVLRASRLLGARLARPTMPLALVEGAGAIGWGLWQFDQTFGAFARNQSNGAYAQMAEIAPAWEWGGGACLAGLALVAGVLAGNRPLRLGGALAVFSGRLFVCVLVASATGLHAAGVPDFAAWAIGALVVFLWPPPPPTRGKIGDD